MRLPLLVAVSITLCAVSCRKPAAHNAVVIPEGESKEPRSEDPMFIGNSLPTPHHTKIESSEIGLTLDDAVRVLGQWDQVGDVMEDSEGQFYPYSNRSGYDYIVRVGKDSSINGVWRRQLKNTQSEQAAPSNR